MAKFSYGLRIKKVMEDKGLKQSELAKKMNVTPGFVNQLILGRRMPGRKTLFDIAGALDVNVSELFPDEARGGRPLVIWCIH